VGHVHLAKNPKGLAVDFEVTGKSRPITYDRAMRQGSDGVQLWIDTLHTRNIHRATRFCHHFSALLIPTADRKTPGVHLAQKSIHRAQEDDPRCRSDAIAATTKLIRNG
jgi:hypothetical protein